MELGSLARASGVRLLALESVDSTNDEARRLIEAGERGPLWVVSSRQTRGHGRLGREWISPPGNLHASLVLGDFGAAAVAPQLGFVAGVAAMRGLRAATAGGGRFALKWPNDLLLDGAKLGGILLENVGVSTGDARAPRASVAIIGVGVNCAEAPRDLPFEARALASIGSNAPDAATLFTHLSDALLETLDLWRGGGFARIRDAWLADAAYLGAHIRVELPRETVEGSFATVDATGRLVLATRDGERVIEAGDVSLGPRQTTAGGVP
ncbi:biotin--[acetyl-CoA-carboxylase] ligase [Methylocystis sp. SC2]|uniref:biotin--[acetyl-CoA-carboxylase] ligase n=1 Tax=Methylocystis sp. (strain SC2) TaxID=187303 RepID=UPI00027AF2C9|nr:biotin--[acetyl-CoA-carboxylase] ligase [Methylocystis sp. SC2]CCJ07187.1 Biotin/acetyl-CoA-carboxylase ligase [Methylocystis sp. SC2]